MFQHLLVPLDDSELATDLVTQAVNFARSIKAKITFFTANEDYSASEEGALQRIISPQDFSEDVHGTSNAILARAKAAANSLGIDTETVTRIGSRPYELILQVAEEKGCDLIYMASHGVSGIKGLFVGSQTQKVLNHTSLPVLVARVEKNSLSHAGDAAIQIIKREHRTIAAVNDALSHYINSTFRSVSFMDVELLTEMLFYIKTYPEKLHHPKEERYIFERLRARSPDTTELISQLENEHKLGGQMLAEIEVELAEVSSMPHSDRSPLMAKVNKFVEMQWLHLEKEENLILPLAKQHLVEQDWVEIERAFQFNEDVKWCEENDFAYEKLFSRLMNHLAQEEDGD